MNGLVSSLSKTYSYLELSTSLSDLYVRLTTIGKRLKRNTYRTILAIRDRGATLRLAEIINDQIHNTYIRIDLNIIQLASNCKKRIGG